MITLQDYFETTGYKITEGDSYGWSCYGPDAYQLSAWNGIHGHGGWSSNIVFDTRDQTVYEVEVCDYTNDRAYRLINPDYARAHASESQSRGVEANQAWDDVEYVDLEVEEDFLDKMSAIIDGLSYDTRVSVPIDIPDAELLTYMKMAHERDMKFNDFVEMALREAIKRHQLSDFDLDYPQDRG